MTIKVNASIRQIEVISSMGKSKQFKVNDLETYED